MPSALTQFFQHHATNLPDPRLLHYELPAWIRFDLQGPLSPKDAGYFAQVLHRATTLFAAAFAPTDEVLLVYQEHRYKRHRIRSNSYLFRQLGIRKRDVTFQKRWARPSQLAYHEGRWIQALYTTLAARIPYRTLLAAISYQDFPDQNKTAIHGLFYFFNQTTGLIFYMYDDRGILVSSNTPEITRPLYQEYNDWILDFDRGTIDALFSEAASTKS
ncbi:DUF3885 domain-containing protein [Hymenobacter canadensis]|uniref:DUF3885 domain-containing protein n=1 Tax=Hymenobacter canadensis TaxID=2999067 RepID=A0ABY7LR04_9BACT|nr:DUF3885 domain-containing protein [Hymenobacter canadensis]WBA42024.1 DUF3885 domain-containing protein [Hymenobacter canadensis]